MKRASLLVALLASACASTKRDEAPAPPNVEPDAPRVVEPEAPRSEPTVEAPPVRVENTAAEEPVLPRRHGARLRLWYVSEWDSERSLLEPSAPNVARVVDALDLSDERRDFGGGSKCVVARVDARLELERSRRVGFRLVGGASTRAYLDGVLFARGPIAETSLALAEGTHELLIEHAGTAPLAPLRLEWDTGSGFEPIAPAALTPLAGLDIGPTIPRTVARIERAPTSVEVRAPTELPPTFELSTELTAQRVQPEVALTGVAWDAHGEALVCTSRGAVLRCANGAAKGRVVAAGLDAPRDLTTLGARAFVLQRTELTELVDRDHDGAFDAFLALLNVWEIGPEMAFAAMSSWKDALFVVARESGGAGRVLRFDTQARSVSSFADGLAAPSRVGAMGELLGVVVEGEPRGNESREPALEVFDESGRRIARAPLALHALELRALGSPALIARGPFAGQALLADPRGFGLLRVDATEPGVASVFPLLDAREVGFPVSRELAVDALCAVVGPDGAIRVGGDRKSNTGGDYPLLQRVQPRDAITFDWTRVRAFEGGFELEFSAPLAPGAGWGPLEFEVAVAHDASSPFRKLRVNESVVADDRRRVALLVDERVSDALVQIALGDEITGADANRPASTQAWFALGLEPAPRPRWIDAALRPSEAELAALARSAGWRDLLEPELPAWDANSARGWLCASGELRPGPKAQPLVSREAFDDFELEFEWRAERGSAALVQYLGSHAYALVDDDAHVFGRNPLRSCGAVFDSSAPSWRAARGLGEWNRSRIVVRGSSVEHWLEGVRVAQFTSQKVAAPLEIVPRGAPITLRALRIRTTRS